MNLQRFFRVVISLKIIIFHPEFLFRKASQSRNRNRLPKVGENIWTVDRKVSRGARRFVPIFHTRISHVFFREVAVLTVTTRGSFRSNPGSHPCFVRVRSATARECLSTTTVPVARSQNNGKTTIGPSQGRWVPHRSTGHFLGASSRRREPAQRTRPDGVAPASVSPPSFTLATSAGRAPKGTSYERSTANHDKRPGGAPHPRAPSAPTAPGRKFLDSEPMLPEEYEDPDDEDVFLNDVLDQKVAPRALLSRCCF